MKKLTKHQRQYRKRKKEASRDMKLVTREDGKRVEKVARKQLCVRVNELAAERLTTCAEERNLNKGELLTHMILWGGGQVLDITEPTWYEKQDGAVQENLVKEGIKYKGSTGTKQLNLAISSTAWNKLETYKEMIGQSKARIVQSIILNYKPTTQAQRDYMKKRNDEMREKYGYWNEVLQPHKEKSDTSKPSKASKKFKLEKYAGELSWVHVKGISPEYWDEEELDEYQRLTGWEI